MSSPVLIENNDNYNTALTSISVALSQMPAYTARRDDSK